MKSAIPVFAGGALGAVLREMMMLIVPVGPRGFPFDILAANLVASTLLGFVASLHQRKVVPDWGYALVGVGVSGGLSTFSSFAYGLAVLGSRSTTGAVVALAYVVTSLTLGYIAVVVGSKLGGREKTPA